MKTVLLRSLCFLAVLTVLPLISSCGDGSTPTDIYVYTDEAQINQEIVDTEEFPLPNCGGTGELVYSLGSQTTVQKSVVIGATATGSGGIEAGIPETVKLELKAEVELAYQQTYETASTRLDSIEMRAAPGTYVVYVIGWKERRFASTVSYAMGGEIYRAPYTYILRAPKISDSRQVSCTLTPTSAAPQPTVDSYPPTQQISTPVPPTAVSSSNCSFIDELVASGAVIQSHYDSSGYYGVWIHLERAIEVPAGWYVRKNNAYGPLTLAAGTVTDIEAPPRCRPLSGGPWGKINCLFLDTLASNGIVQEWLYYPPEVLGGAVVELTNSVEVPRGWTVQRGLGDEYGPMSLPAGATASFWSSIDCRPLRAP